MKIHPSDLLLQEFAKLFASDHRQTMGHLLECPECQKKLEALLRPKRSVVATKVAKILDWSKRPNYEIALHKTVRIFQIRRCAFSKERMEAVGLFSEVMGQPTERRQVILENNPRFHTWGLLELMLDRAREESFWDPGRGEETAALALELADRLDPHQYGPELLEDMRARGWAYLGNARRMRSELAEAEEAFHTAFTYLEQGTHEPLETATLLDLRASLARDQRRFDEALHFLHRAVDFFREVGDLHRTGRSLVNMSSVYEQMGSADLAIPVLYEAVDLIDPAQEPRLLLCARHNLITNLAETGRFMEARGLLADARALYRQFPDPWTQNRRRWVEGKIARGLGQGADAERHFQAACAGFLAEGIPYDTALVALELASLYAEQGRVAELKSLTHDIAPIFSSRLIHREALAALGYLQRAIEAEEVSLELVSEVARYLKRAQSDPRLRFEQVAAGA
jgi:tetratricopeptide (TPR) repeat protein